MTMKKKQTKQVKHKGTSKLTHLFKTTFSPTSFPISRLIYNSDISKSNKRQISKSNISKTAAIFEK